MTKKSKGGLDDEVSKPFEGLPYRSSYDGPRIQFFISEKAVSKLSANARQQIHLDNAWIVQQRLQREVSLLKSENSELKAAHSGKKKKKSPSPKATRSQLRSDDSKNELAFNNRLGPASILAKHYGVSKQAVQAILNAAEKEENINPKARPGRPSQLTPTKRQVIAETYNKGSGRFPLTKVSKRMEGQTTWLTQKLGVVRTSPSPSTLSRTMNDGTWAKHMVRKRPYLDEIAIAERKKFAPEALTRTDDITSCHDEAYVEIGLKNGSILVDLSAQTGVKDEHEEDQDIPVKFDSGGKHEPKVFLFGATTKPRTFEKNGKLLIDPIFNGKIFLARIRGVKKRQRTTKLGGVAVEGKKVGDPIYENVTIDGFRYKEICEKPNGLFDAIEAYHHPERRTGESTARVFCIDLDAEKITKPLPPSRNEATTPPSEMFFISQEDGAPGHGYNNRQGGKETAIHEALVHNASVRGIHMLKQSRHSPEFNFMDLGVWYCLKKAVERRCDEMPDYTGKNAGEIEAAIWKIVKEEWDELDPVKLYNIAEQRRVLLQRCIELDGQSIKKEPHTGIRKRRRVELATTEQ
jgi:hypothetical protein